MISQKCDNRKYVWFDQNKTSAPELCNGKDNQYVLHNFMAYADPLMKCI